MRPLVCKYKNTSTSTSLFWFDSAGFFLSPDGSVFDWKAEADRVLCINGGWSLESRVHCPNLVLFYFILGVFAPQKLDRPQTASQVL